MEKNIPNIFTYTPVYESFICVTYSTVSRDILNWIHLFRNFRRDTATIYQQQYDDFFFFFEYKRREEFSLFCLVYIRIYVFACVWDPFSNLFHHQLFSLNTETQHTNSCANKIDLSVKIIHTSNILTHIRPFIWNGGCVSHHFSLSLSLNGIRTCHIIPDKNP